MGVCGSDVHYYLHGRIGDQIVQYPGSVGHECAGTVVEAGPEATNVAAGDRVFIDPAIACGACDQCRRGRANTCRRLQFMGCPGGVPGAAAEYAVMPAENCFPIPPSLPLETAVLIEPLCVGLHAVRLGGVARGMRLVIFGAGPIGLSVLVAAKATAPCTVYVTDLLDERLAVARQCGADWTGNARDAAALHALAAAEPEGVELVFECSGDPACIDAGQRLLAPGGMLLLVGIPAGEQVGFDPHHMRREELTMKAVRRQRGCVAAMIGLFEPGPHRSPPAADPPLSAGRNRRGLRVGGRLSRRRCQGRGRSGVGSPTRLDSPPKAVEHIMSGQGAMSAFWGAGSLFIPIHLPPISRRQFLAGSAAAGALLMTRPGQAAQPPVDPNRWALDVRHPRLRGPQPRPPGREAGGELCPSPQAIARRQHPARRTVHRRRLRVWKALRATTPRCWSWSGQSGPPACRCTWSWAITTSGRISARRSAPTCRSPPPPRR